METKITPHWKRLALTPEQRIMAEMRGDLRMKTHSEIMADCRALEASGRKINARKRKPVEKVYTDAERLDILSQVHGLINKGVASTDACIACGITYNLFLQWRRRYKIKEPKLNGTGTNIKSRRVAK